MENLYTILGIPVFSSFEEVKSAYRKLSMKYHPDNYINASDEEKNYNKNKQQELNRIWDMVSTEDKKNSYDASLKKSMQVHLANANIFNSDFSSKASNNASKANTFYEQYVMNMMNDIFKSNEEDIDLECLHQRRIHLKDLIGKRERDVRLKSYEYTNSMKKEVNDLEKGIIDLSKCQVDLKSQISNKNVELNNLYNRKMYQLMPKRFASIENILMTEIQKLQAEDSELSVKLEESKNKLNVLKDKIFNYTDECIKNDSELIELNQQLYEIEQQIMNSSSYRAK